tara:strand:- start:205 stop:606 length:402 start_codon:yes stop_codon:yes gene_type:complete
MTKYDIIKDWKDTIINIIEDVIEYDFNKMSTKDLILNKFYISEKVEEQLWQTIDGCQDVIYYHKAEKISNVIGLYNAFDTSDMTGQQFKSWCECAFENIYTLIYNEIDINNLIIDTIANIEATKSIKDFKIKL